MILATQRPEDIVDRTDPADLQSELRTAENLTSEAQRALDFVLRQWTLRGLSRTGDIEGLLELDDLSALAMRALPNDASSDAYRTRWQAFRDLLESKRLALGGRESGRARNLLHATPILEMLKAGPKPQREIQVALRLSVQRLSQVLGVMEEGGLVQRQKQGKEKVVSLASDPASPRLGGAATKSIGGIVWAVREPQVA